MITQTSFDQSNATWKNAFAKNDLQAPFLTWDWHDMWRNVFLGSSEDLTLIYNDSVVIPLIVHGDNVTLSGGEEIADYLDIIGPDSHKKTAWTETISFLRSRGIKTLTLRNIPHTSPTRDHFESIGASVTKEDTTPMIRLPNNWNAYLALLPKKYRHELERKIRKFQREHIDATVAESSNPAKDIETLLRLMEKDDNKRIFLTDKMKQFFQSIPMRFSDTVSIFTVTSGDKAIASTMSFSVNGTYYLYNSGFDKDCCTIAGFYCKAMTVKHTIESGYSTYNFLQGNERYKYELGAEDYFVYKISYTL